MPALQCAAQFNGPPKKTMHKPNPSDRPTRYPFIFGGSAAAATTLITHPLDLVKVRLQTRVALRSSSLLSTFVDIYHTHGVPGLYAGLTASMLRQLTYSTVRFGVYDYLKVRSTQLRAPNDPSTKPSPLSLIVLSSSAGFLGGIAGNPADVVNVRMQSHASTPQSAQRRYRNALDGLVRIVREERLPALFRGVGPNCARAVLMTSSQLASYDIFKTMCLSTLQMSDGLFMQFISSVAAGLIATTIWSPVDVVKTLIMSNGGKLPLLQTLQRMQQKGGFGWVFRRWVPSFVRLGPQTIITMLILEQQKRPYRRWKRLTS